MLPRPGAAPPKEVATVREAAAESGPCLHTSLSELSVSCTAQLALLPLHNFRPGSSLAPSRALHVNERRNDPSVDGARIPSNSAGIAPCRSRSRSSMLSAPATIPGTLTWAFALHGQRHHRYRLARDTRFGSSNVAWIFARSCKNRTCEVSSRLGHVVTSEPPIVPVQRAPFASTRPV
jgi:hypothetical protein